MYGFSHKVNKGRCNPEIKRQSSYQSMTPLYGSSSDNSSNDKNEHHLQEQNVEQEKLQSTLDKMNDNYVSSASRNIYVEGNNE